jgi:hypothetical protein
MSYLSVREGQIIKHFRDRNGFDAEKILPAARVACSKCGWSLLLVAGEKPPERCICGGDLR